LSLTLSITELLITNGYFDSSVGKGPPGSALLERTQKAWILFQGHLIQRYLEYSKARRVLRQVSDSLDPQEVDKEVAA
jgi:hypothetical protein